MAKRPVGMLLVVILVLAVVGGGVWLWLSGGLNGAGIGGDNAEPEKQPAVTEKATTAANEAKEEVVPPGFELVEDEHDKSRGAPDQPGWTAKPLAADFDMSIKEFIKLRTLTQKMGLPVSNDGRLVLEPFEYAAIEQKDNPREKKDYELVISEMLTILREQRIFTAANPIITFSADPRVDPAARWFVGVPVGKGTKVSLPLILRQINGGEVEISKLFALKDDGEKKGEMMSNAANEVGVGKVPGRIAYFRFSGWNDWTLEGKGVHAQAIGYDNAIPKP